MVDVRKAAGDTLEYHKVSLSLSLSLSPSLAFYFQALTRMLVSFKYDLVGCILDEQLPFFLANNGELFCAKWENMYIDE